jgi:hypothetical protein
LTSALVLTAGWLCFACFLNVNSVGKYILELKCIFFASAYRLPKTFKCRYHKSFFFK